MPSLLRSSDRPTRSLYALTRQEITRGIANRFVHSRAYIFLYLGMAALSITTVILSMQDGCPGLAFYILELIINTTMIAEVAVRFIAFGRVRGYLAAQSIDTNDVFRQPAILEVRIQYRRLNINLLLRYYRFNNRVRWMWCDEQRGRDARHAPSRRSERAAVHASCGCNATVSARHCPSVTCFADTQCADLDNPYSLALAQ